MSYQEQQDLYSIIVLLNNLTLLPIDIFEQTYPFHEIDKTNYGIIEFSFVSYGPYFLKESYNFQNDWIFEKNEFFDKKDEYFLKNIIYKKNCFSKRQI
ncbi:hypothetical protein [Candidatus Phytoplasma prunorum]|uniref:hypothetical protein n=1 Tax=Candidatus Phytoplasma prunorum TaxID=47565 RepID=UPI002FF13985